jgi:regulatory helix-turn-helix LysR family protein
MEMHQVRYFLAVAKELNFSRAAEKSNVSQPSLSRGRSSNWRESSAARSSTASAISRTLPISAKWFGLTLKLSTMQLLKPKDCPKI